MSEEEIINRLNSIIKEWQKIVNIKDKQEREIEMSMYIEDMPFYEIQGLLDLYNKEKEKNEGLQELYTGALQDWSREKEKNKELERYKKYYQNERNLLDSYISKDKIKELLEKLDKEEKQELKGVKGQDRYFIKQLYQAQKNVVQELLEVE